MGRKALCALIAAGIVTTAISCNNGNYNTNPETQSTNTQAGSLQLGQMQATIDGTLYTFGFGNWTATADTSIFLTAYRQLTAGPSDVHTIAIHVEPYTGPATYSHDYNNDYMYMLSIYSNNGSAYLSYGDLEPPSHFSVQIESIESNNIKGKFSGVIYKVSGTGADSTAITNGSFYLPKL